MGPVGPRHGTHNICMWYKVYTWGQAQKTSSVKKLGEEKGRFNLWDTRNDNIPDIDGIQSDNEGLWEKFEMVIIFGWYYENTTDIMDKWMVIFHQSLVVT